MKKKRFGVEQIDEALKHAKAGATVMEGIRKVGIREMVFSDTGVIIPCLVRLLNCEYR
jgi:hypothetical protein